eukprot:PhF_6_TR7055/c0_g2_i3/m.10638
MSVFEWHRRFPHIARSLLLLTSFNHHHNNDLPPNTEAFILPFDVSLIVSQLICSPCVDVQNITYAKSIKPLSSCCCGVVSLTPTTIAVVHRNLGSIALYDTDTGECLKEIKSAKHVLDQPTAIVSLSDDIIAVCDCDHLGLQRKPPTPPPSPPPILPQDHHTTQVVGNCIYIIRWSDSTFLQRIGSFGYGPSNLWCPYAATKVADDTMLVADQGNQRFQLVHWNETTNPLGAFIKQIPYHHGEGHNEFNAPTCITKVPNTASLVAVACWLNRYIKLFDWGSGSVIRSFQVGKGTILTSLTHSPFYFLIGWHREHTYTNTYPYYSVSKLEPHPHEKRKRNRPLQATNNNEGETFEDHHHNDDRHTLGEADEEYDDIVLVKDAGYPTSVNHSGGTNRVHYSQTVSATVHDGTKVVVVHGGRRSGIVVFE